MALPDFSIGHKERAFAKVEPSFGVIADATTSDHVRLHGSFGIARRKQRLNENDKRDTASPVGAYDVDHFVEWSFPEGNCRPSGSLAAEPELGAFFLGLLGAKNTANLTTTISASPTTSGATLASGTGLQKGDLVRIGSHVRRLASVNGAAVTWEPPLPSAPSTGTAVTSGTTYKPIADPSVSLTLLRDLDSAVEIYPGCWVNEGSVKWTRNGFLVASFAGRGMGKRTRAGASLVATAALTTSSTEVQVTAGEGRLFDVADGYAYAMIDSEIVKLTPGSGADKFAIARAQLGSTAAAHTIGAEVRPYRPTATLIGQAVTGIRGFLYVVDDDGLPQAVGFENAEVRIQNGFEDRREAGSEFAIGYYRRDAMRSVTFNAAIKLRRLTGLLRDAADKARKIGVVLVCGSAVGNTFAVVMPRIIIDAEPLPDSPENGDAMVTLTGTAYASSGSEEDAISIGSL